MIIKSCESLLANNPEPIIQWKFKKSFITGEESPISSAEAREKLEESPIIHQLLIDRDRNGQIPFPVYDKWFGAHWVLAILADLGYPSGDESLKPLMEQCYQMWLSKHHEKHIKMINGRVRRCASQEGNCIYYSLVLGLADERTEELATRLLKWQWVDGGWNCDKKPEAFTSSFNETLIPLRGLAWFSKATGDPKIARAVDRAAEVFLQRNMYIGMRDRQVIDNNFVRLHYPNYWHYDILFGLKVMAEAGFIGDPRCLMALDLLESKQLPDGGFPAEDRYYRRDDRKLAGHSHVDWGGTSKHRMNPFVTLDALWVLKQAGRLDG